MNFIFRRLWPALALTATPALAEPYTLSNGHQVAALETFRECDICPDMIVLPMGDFIMGAPPDEKRRFDISEGPQHRVTVDIPIAMGRNEVTYDDWMACVADGGCDGYIPPERVGRQFSRPGDDEFYWIGGRHPVTTVSYAQALTYTAWLNTVTGTDAYRLPSEAEWEYAARAGTTTRFAQGDMLTRDQAQFNGSWAEIEAKETPSDPPPQGPVPVDALDAANHWGLRHMSGNVAEWTQSCLVRPYEGWSTTSDWLEKAAGPPECTRSTRGGSSMFRVESARVARRTFAYIPGEVAADQWIGFRVTRELD